MKRKKTVITGRAAAARTRIVPPGPPRPQGGPVLRLPGERIRAFDLEADAAERNAATARYAAGGHGPGTQGAGGRGSGTSAGRGTGSAGGRATSAARERAADPGAPGAAPATIDLTVDLAPTRPGALVLRTPILVAAGTFGYGVEYGEVVDVERLGAICSKGTTLKPRTGNVPPRVTEAASGMLNAIGLQNPGVDAVIARYAETWSAWEVPVIVNVAGESVDDYVAVARKLDAAQGIAGIELNVSCPNVGKGGLQFALDAEAAASVTRAVRAVTDLPLIVKMSPAATDVRRIASALADAGADALSAVNTLPGMAMDRERRRPFLGNTYGGLSGPALKPVALRVVYEIAQAVEIPIVAIGGVSGLDDVLDYLMAGASAVAVGTAVFGDPVLPVRLADALAEHCRGEGIATHRDLVGAALPARRDRPSARGVEYRP
ncbi:MAG: dihydroorotate dehydrogenase [Chloroflexota bacterium]